MKQLKCCHKLEKHNGKVMSKQYNTKFSHVEEFGGMKIAVAGTGYVGLQEHQVSGIIKYL